MTSNTSSASGYKESDYKGSGFKRVMLAALIPAMLAGHVCASELPSTGVGAWQMFRGNADHTASVGPNIPLNTSGKLLWKFCAAGGIDSSPVICKGVVYVGSDDGYFYAIGE